jgi:amino-acid N-acetyltransferase
MKWLEANHLPFEDIKVDGTLMIRYLNDDDKLIGCGGLEFYSDSALMRSVAVHSEQRNISIGRSIVNDLLDRARDRSIREVYLLTETAHDYFVRLGFTDVPRDQVPQLLHTSSEFSSVCPVSAACMVYRINNSIVK